MATGAHLSISVPHAQPSCLLFGLPPELRNRICRLVLVESGLKSAHQDELTTRVSILTTSKAIYEEAISIFLGENDYYIPVTGDLPRLTNTVAHIKALGPSSKHTRHLVIENRATSSLEIRAEQEDRGYYRRRVSMFFLVAETITVEMRRG